MSNSGMTEMDNKPGKIYVLDTTVLIYDLDIMSKTAEADWVIPLVVIRELDGLKNSDKELVAKAARQIARTLDRLSSYGDLVTGVKLPTGRTLRVFAGYESVDALASDADNKILGAALSLKNAGEDITLFTTDTNMRTVARAYGVKAEYTPIFDIETPLPAPPTNDIGNSRASAQKRAPRHNVQTGGKFLFQRWGVSGVFMRLCFVVAIVGFVTYFFTPKIYRDTVNMVTGFALLGGIALMVYRALVLQAFHPSKAARDASVDVVTSAAYSDFSFNIWHKKEED